MNYLDDPREDAISAALHDADEHRHDIKWRERHPEYDERDVEVVDYYRSRARIVLDALKAEALQYQRFKEWQRNGEQ